MSCQQPFKMGLQSPAVMHVQLSSSSQPLGVHFTITKIPREITEAEHVSLAAKWWCHLPFWVRWKRINFSLQTRTKPLRLVSRKRSRCFVYWAQTAKKNLYEDDETREEKKCWPDYFFHWSLMNWQGKTKIKHKITTVWLNGWHFWMFEFPGIFFFWGR